MYQSGYPGGLKLPELGNLDKVIYDILIELTCLGSVGGVVAFLILANKLPLADPAVAGFANPFGRWGMLLVGILMIFVIHQLIRGRIRKYPIFGVKGISYGGEAYTPVYPLLMPAAKAPEEVKQKVREGRQLALFLPLGILLAVILFITSLLGGHRLDADGGVRVLWGPGVEVLSYEPEEVSQVTVTFRQHHSRHGVSTKKAYVIIQIQTGDNRHYAFRLDEFRKDGEQTQVELLKQILDNYTGTKLRVEGESLLEDVVRDQGYSQKDHRILLELIRGTSLSHTTERKGGIK